MSSLFGVSSATRAPRTGWDKETTGPRDKMAANLLCNMHDENWHTWSMKLAGYSNYKTRDW